MARLAITEAKAAGNLSVDLLFNDTTRQRINVGEFIRKHPHPMYDKYLNEDEFNKFYLDGGNIVWGEDWDIIFPIEQLHSGIIS